MSLFRRNISHKAKASEFQTTLKTIYTAESAYEAENGRYLTLDNDEAFKEIGLDGDPSKNSKFFNYSVECESNTKFIATATIKNKGFGKVSEKDFATINQDGDRSITENLSKYAPKWKSNN